MRKIISTLSIVLVVLLISACGSTRAPLSKGSTTAREKPLITTDSQTETSITADGPTVQQTTGSTIKNKDISENMTSNNTSERTLESQTGQGMRLEIFHNIEDLISYEFTGESFLRAKNFPLLSESKKCIEPILPAAYGSPVIGCEPSGMIHFMYIDPAHLQALPTAENSSEKLSSIVIKIDAKIREPKATGSLESSIMKNPILNKETMSYVMKNNQEFACKSDLKSEKTSIFTQYETSGFIRINVDSTDKTIVSDLITSISFRTHNIH